MDSASRSWAPNKTDIKNSVFSQFGSQRNGGQALQYGKRVFGNSIDYIDPNSHEVDVSPIMGAANVKSIGSVISFSFIDDAVRSDASDDIAAFSEHKTSPVVNSLFEPPIHEPSHHQLSSTPLPPLPGVMMQSFRHRDAIGASAAEALSVAAAVNKEDDLILSQGGKARIGHLTSSSSNNNVSNVNNNSNNGSSYHNNNMNTGGTHTIYNNNINNTNSTVNRTNSNSIQLQQNQHQQTRQLSESAVGSSPMSSSYHQFQNMTSNIGQISMNLNSSSSVLKNYHYHSNNVHSGSESNNNNINVVVSTNVSLTTACTHNNQIINNINNFNNLNSTHANGDDNCELATPTPSSSMVSPPDASTSISNNFIRAPGETLMASMSRLYNCAPNNGSASNNHATVSAPDSPPPEQRTSFAGNAPTRTSEASLPGWTGRTSSACMHASGSAHIVTNTPVSTSTHNFANRNRTISDPNASTSHLPLVPNKQQSGTSEFNQHAPLVNSSRVEDRLSTGNLHAASASPPPHPHAAVSNSPTPPQQQSESLNGHAHSAGSPPPRLSSTLERLSRLQNAAALLEDQSEGYAPHQQITNQFYPLGMYPSQNSLSNFNLQLSGLNSLPNQVSNSSISNILLSGTANLFERQRSISGANGRISRGTSGTGMVGRPSASSMMFDILSHDQEAEGHLGRMTPSKIPLANRQESETLVSVRDDLHRNRVSQEEALLVEVVRRVEENRRKEFEAAQKFERAEHEKIGRMSLLSSYDSSIEADDDKISPSSHNDDFIEEDKQHVLHNSSQFELGSNQDATMPSADYWRNTDGDDNAISGLQTDNLESNSNCARDDSASNRHHIRPSIFQRFMRRVSVSSSKQSEVHSIGGTPNIDFTRRRGTFHGGRTSQSVRTDSHDQLLSVLKVQGTTESRRFFPNRVTIPNIVSPPPVVAPSFPSAQNSSNFQFPGENVNKGLASNFGVLLLPSASKQALSSTLSYNNQNNNNNICYIKNKNAFQISSGSSCKNMNNHNQQQQQQTQIDGRSPSTSVSVLSFAVPHFKLHNPINSNTNNAPSDPCYIDTNNLSSNHLEFHQMNALNEDGIYHQLNQSNVNTNQNFHRHNIISNDHTNMRSSIEHHNHRHHNYHPEGSLGFHPEHLIHPHHGNDDYGSEVSNLSSHDFDNDGDAAVVTHLSYQHHNYNNTNNDTGNNSLAHLSNIKKG